MQCTGNSGCFPWGKRAAIVPRYPVIFFLLSAVFSFFRNPPNSDMDYRSFNVRTWPLLWVRIRMGVGHTDNESALHSDSEKLSQFVLACSWRGRGSNLWSLDLELMLYQLSHPVTPERFALNESDQLHCVICGYVYLFKYNDNLTPNPIRNKSPK